MEADARKSGGSDGNARSGRSTVLVAAPERLVATGRSEPGYPHSRVECPPAEPGLEKIVILD